MDIVLVLIGVGLMVEMDMMVEPTHLEVVEVEPWEMELLCIARVIKISDVVVLVDCQ